MRLLLICIPESRRTALLRAAAARWPELELRVMHWIDLIEGTVDLRDVVRWGDVVHIDSPGKDFPTELALLRFGLLEGRELAGAPESSILDRLAFDRGRILWPSLWFAGFSAALHRIRTQLSQCPPHRRTKDPDEVRVMFDKPATHERLARAGVPVPEAIPGVRSLDQLIEEMRSRRWGQAFVKLACGSSASGAVAIRLGRDRMLAQTTVEIDSRDETGGLRLYNTRRVRRFESIAEIRMIVDALCLHRVHVERWLPKAGIDGRGFDLRVVMIGGEPRQTVARLSRSPMTNLHLLNSRGDAARVRKRCGPAVWEAAMESCRRAMVAFPGTVCAGVDLLIGASFRRHAILELNAFGDLLPGIQHDGMDAHAAQFAEAFGVPPVATQCSTAEVA